jgi:two-component system, NarL family, nitrate/nitrite response regulator NarL
MRLVLCDDNRILCEALASILQARGHQVVAIATSVIDTIAAVATHRPDACLLDLRFPDGSGLDAAGAIRRCHPDTKILVLSCLDDPAVLLEAKKIGVAGFLRKDGRADTIIGALDLIGGGGAAFGPKYSGQASWRVPAPSRGGSLGTLTLRETQVPRRIVAGQSTEQMAREMDVATSTLRSYIKNVLAKLGAHSRLQAAAIASRQPGLFVEPAGSRPAIEFHASLPLSPPMDMSSRGRREADGRRAKAHRSHTLRPERWRRFSVMAINVLVADQERTFAEALAARLEAERT